jgi:hypothetical protein
MGDTVADATRAELERLKVLDTVEGQAALRLAEALDSGRSIMAAAATVKELRSTMDVLRDRTPKAKDSVDEFSARRAARRAAQG